MGVQKFISKTAFFFSYSHVRFNQDIPILSSITEILNISENLFFLKARLKILVRGLAKTSENLLIYATEFDPALKLWFSFPNDGA